MDLSNNQLLCSCSSIPSISLMSQTKPTNLVFNNYDECLCLNRVNDIVHVHNMNLHSLWFDCLRSVVFMGIGFACAFVLITIILILAVTIYRKCPLLFLNPLVVQPPSSIHYPLPPTQTHTLPPTHPHPHTHKGGYCEEGGGS